MSLFAIPLPTRFFLRCQLKTDRAKDACSAWPRLAETKSAKSGTGRDPNHWVMGSIIGCWGLSFCVRPGPSLGVGSIVGWQGLSFSVALYNSVLRSFILCWVYHSVSGSIIWCQGLSFSVYHSIRKHVVVSASNRPEVS